MARVVDDIIQVVDLMEMSLYSTLRILRDNHDDDGYLSSSARPPGNPGGDFVNAAVPPLVFIFVSILCSSSSDLDSDTPDIDIDNQGSVDDGETGRWHHSRNQQPHQIGKRY